MTSVAVFLQFEACLRAAYCEKVTFLAAALRQESREGMRTNKKTIKVQKLHENGHFGFLDVLGTYLSEADTYL